MDELHELRDYVLQGRTNEALHLIDELDAMSRHSTVSNLLSFLVLALTHLMKMDVEKRLTRSWQNSIRNALLEIKDRNLMGNKASYYLRLGDWDEYIDTAYIKALSNASAEAFGGKYKSSELSSSIVSASAQWYTIFLCFAMRVPLKNLVIRLMNTWNLNKNLISKKWSNNL